MVVSPLQHMSLWWHFSEFKIPRSVVSKNILHAAHILPDPFGISTTDGAHQCPQAIQVGLELLSWRRTSMHLPAFVLDSSPSTPWRSCIVSEYAEQSTMPSGEGGLCTSCSISCAPASSAKRWPALASALRSLSSVTLPLPLSHQSPASALHSRLPVTLPLPLLKRGGC